LEGFLEVNFGKSWILVNPGSSRRLPLAQRFPNKNKPSMKEFVTQIRDDGCRNAHKYKETLAGNRAVQAREPPNIPKIPDDYPRLT
jgi:hypothetical protein